VDSSREEDFRQQREERWPINSRDIGAITEAVMLIAGAKEGLSQLFSWTPRSIRLRVAELIVPRMLTRGRAELIEAILFDDRIVGFLKCWLLVPLARAGRRPTTEAFGHVLADKRLLRIANPRKAQFGHGRESTYKFFDTVLSACELWAASFRNSDDLRMILKRLSGNNWRKASRLWAHDTELLFV
jgi:phage shock protein PspC (stress-responsive transcriptional regulator)